MINQTTEIKEIEKKVKSIKNRGTGAGGSNTNLNGKKYENDTMLSSHFKIIANKKINKNKNSYEEIQFEDSDIKYIHLQQSTFNMFMKEILERNENIFSAPGCRNPDDSYIDLENKKIFIIEKKFQQTTGSVEEKIQSGCFKQNHYSDLFPNFEINYIYCLSSWFRNKDNQSVIKYLTQQGIRVFFNDEKDFKIKIIKYIIETSNQKIKKIYKESLDNELPIRHCATKFGNHKWFGEYNKKNDTIISNDKEYKSFNDFIKEHYLFLQNEYNKQNKVNNLDNLDNLDKCEIYINNKWKLVDINLENKESSMKDTKIIKSKNNIDETINNLKKVSLKPTKTNKSKKIITLNK
jgi:hypothetical protein